MTTVAAKWRVAAISSDARWLALWRSFRNKGKDKETKEGKKRVKAFYRRTVTKATWQRALLRVSSAPLSSPLSPSKEDVFHHQKDVPSDHSDDYPHLYRIRWSDRLKAFLYMSVDGEGHATLQAVDPVKGTSTVLYRHPRPL